jgi:hypothetical protein
MDLKKLNECFSYDRNNGKLYWKKSFKRLPKLNGKEVGHIYTNPKGMIKYRRLRFEGKNYFAHRLIWMIVYGEIPNIIDHIDGDGLNNRVENLRNTTGSVNQMNRRSHRAGRLVGSSFWKTRRIWRSQVNINGKVFIFGWFKTEEEAHLAFLFFKEWQKGEADGNTGQNKQL